MKKILLGLFVVVMIGVAGGVFYAGWVQTSVPPGDFGIMRSKTHGLDSRVVREGEFRWAWYKLIPTNVTVEVFNLHTVTRTVGVKGSLVTVGDYAPFEEFNTDFSFDIDAHIAFNIQSDSLVTLINTHHINNQQDLDSYYEQLATAVESSTKQHIYEAIQNPAQRDTLFRTDHLMDAIKTEFPFVSELSIFVMPNILPDVELYQSIRAAYTEYVQTENQLKQMKEQLRTLAFENRLDDILDTWLRMESLKQYGELLTQYPILMDYLKLEYNGLDPSNQLN
jgi:hypothetical protein